MDYHITPVPKRTLVLYHAEVHERFITFTDVSAISTTVTTNNVSLPMLTDGEYTEVINDSNTVLHTIGEIRLSLFTDASATIFALDSSGNPIDKKLVATTLYTYPYTDSNNNEIQGYLTTTFSDGTSIGNDDSNTTSYWYIMEGLNKPPQLYS
jgi:hypothetical protein